MYSKNPQLRRRIALTVLCLILLAGAVAVGAAASNGSSDHTGAVQRIATDDTGTETNGTTTASGGTADPSGDSASRTLTGSEQADVSGFGDIETAQRGDIVEIPVRGPSPGGYLTVTLGSREDGYVSNVTVHDEDGDGSVTLLWNSYIADGDQRTDDENPWRAAGGDSVVAQNSLSSIADGPTHLITTGTYTLKAREGRIQNGAASQPPEALNTLTLEARSTENIETWTAPAAAIDGSTDLSDFESRAGDDLTIADEIAEGDVLVTSIEASGLEGVFRAQDGDDATAKFYRAVNNDIITLNHTHLVDGATNRQTDTITVNSRETLGDVAMIPDYENDVYYVVHDTSAEERFQAGRSFRTQFTVESRFESEANFGLVAPTSSGEFEDEVVADEFDMVRPSIDISTTPQDLVEVQAEPRQAVSGTSTYAPGTVLEVRLQAKTGSSSQFIIGPEEITVQRDGTWQFIDDFSQYNVGSKFTVRVQKGDNEPLTADGEIRGEPEVRTLEFNDQEVLGQVVRITEVELNLGGFLAIREGSADGPLLGASEYIEESSPEQNLRVILDEPLASGTTLVAVPHVDSNNNQEFDPETDDRYTGGSPVTDSARVTLEGSQSDYTVSELNPADLSVNPGDRFTLTATVTNDGDAAGQQSVEYRIDGSTVSSQDVSLDPGEARTVEFSDIDTTGLDGSYSHGVYTADDSQVGTLAVDATGEAAQFAVSGFEPGDTSVSAGEQLFAAAAVTNTGSTAGQQSVEYRIENQPVARQEVSLGPGDQTVIEFEAIDVPGIGSGSYTHGVYSGDDSETATLTVGMDTPPEETGRFEIVGVEPGDTTAAPSEQIDVSTTVENPGEESATRSIELRIDGEILTRTTETVSAGAQRQIGLSPIFTDDLTAGPHTYEVSTGDDSLTSTLTVEESLSGTVESLSFDGGTAGTDEASLGAVELSEGGFVAVYANSSSGELLGASEYLEGGQRHDNVTVSYSQSLSDGSDVVAVAHYDTNGNEAFDYASSGRSEDVPYATSSEGIAQQQVSGGDGASESGVSPPSSGIVGDFGLIPLLAVGLVGLGVVGYGVYRFQDDDDTVAAGAQADQSPASTTSGPDGATESAASGGAATAARATDEGTPDGQSAGAAAGGSGEVDPESQLPLEREVPALSGVTEREIGDRLATYGATIATRDGEVTTEVIAVAPDVGVDDGLVDRFERTVGQWYNASTHPNVRTVHDWGTEPRPWIATDDLSGVETLAEVHTSLSLEEVSDVVGDVTEAVRNVGLYNGVHHNLSLDCVRLLDEQEGYTAVVDDWGLERTVRAHLDGEYITPYTAPEQLDDSTVGDQTDVYGLGAVTYHVVTGGEPTTADADAIRESDITPANEYVRIPDEVNDTVMTALSKDPSERQQSPYDFGQAIKSALQ